MLYVVRAKVCRVGATVVAVLAAAFGNGTAAVPSEHPKHHHESVEFTIRSISDGRWSDPQIWSPARVPRGGDRVLISGGTHVEFDVELKSVVRLVQIVGTLHFARDRSTELNVGLVTVRHSDRCTEHGFACEFEGAAEGPTTPVDRWPSLIVGTREEPIPAEHTAVIRLHFLDGMDRNAAPAIACCSGRMDIHGASMSRTWVKLGETAAQGDSQVVLAESVSGWRVGDEVIITQSEGGPGFGSFRDGARRHSPPQTERRAIVSIDKTVVRLDRPLEHEHSGTGEFRCEVANLSRNVRIESADPDGVRGHTVYHRFSRGSIRYARFAHLGKEGVLGRYAIHYHLVGDTMRGSCVEGVSIVDSHNRWVTVHGTQYLVVRDCVGYQSVGHGFFLEDGTEVYNLFDRNLAVHAFSGPRLKKQALPFDQNDGAGFWWANGLNSFVRNVGVENDQYAFRYDIQKRSNFDPRLPIRQPDGTDKITDVRTIPIWRFDDNEAHGNFAGMVVAANGGDQPDSGIRTQRMLERIRRVDWTGPDIRHPHVIRRFKIWRAHYALRPQSPAMLMEDIRIHSAAYGIYRPCFENQVYRNLHLTGLGPEPFNRGMDDASAQVGSITVDGLRIDDLTRGNQRHPFIHMTDNALGDGAACHFRNIELGSRDGRRPLFNLGGSQLVDPIVDQGVPYFVHDYYGAGRHAKIVSVKAKNLLNDGNDYQEERPITGDESRIAEVTDVEWPELLKPVDDLPPATIITSIHRLGARLVVRGLSHDNGNVVRVLVNRQAATIRTRQPGIASWVMETAVPSDGRVTAFAEDDAGNTEKTAHVTTTGDWPVVDR